MSSFPKHEPEQPKKPRKGPSKANKATITPITADPSDPITETGFLAVFSDIHEALAALAQSAENFAANSYRGENALDLFTGLHSPPMRLVLEGEAVDKIADAFTVIADHLVGKKVEEKTTA